jgi:hypothetical protein
VKHTYIFNGDTLADEVQVNLHMLRALELDEVGRDIDSADVVAVDESVPHQQTMELLEKLTKPGRLGDTVGHDAVLGLDTGAADDMLPLRQPGDEVVS